MADEKRSSHSTGSWEDEKKEFARKVFQETLVFVKHDNEIMASFATITRSLARHLEEHPETVASLLRDRAATLKEDLEGGDLAGGSPSVLGGLGSALGDLTDFMKEIIMKDKDFFLKLIAAAFGL